MNGWVKLDRALLDWRYKKKPEYVALWVHLLLEANHKPNKWQEIEIGSGELVTSINKLSSETGITIQRVRTILKKLESEEITSKPTNKYTLISIVNWDKYQCEEGQTNKQTNKQLTNNQQTTNKQLTTNKNDKNDKNERSNSNTNVLLAQDDESSRALYRLPLNIENTFHLIYQEDIDHYKELYPGVDVEQEIRNMVGWSEANPINRKTKKGATRFINNWLIRKQNQAHTPIKKKGDSLFYATE